MRRFAASFGIMDMGHPTHMPNTRRALAAAEYARERGRLTPFRQLAMDAHWREGRDLEDPAVIAAVATAAGIDAEGATAAMDAPAYLARVAAVRAEADRAGVTGIPTFFLGGVSPAGAGGTVTDPSSRGHATHSADAPELPIVEVVVGCQPYGILAAAAERAGAKRIIG